MAVRYNDSQALYSDSTVTYDGRKKHFVTLSVTVTLAPDSIKKSLSLNESVLALLSYFPHREIKAVASVSFKLAPSYNKLGTFLRTFDASVSVLGGAFKRLFLVFSSSLSLASSYSRSIYLLAAAATMLLAERSKVIAKSISREFFISSTSRKHYELTGDLDMAVSASPFKHFAKEVWGAVSLSLIKLKRAAKIGSGTILISTDKQRYYELTGNLDVSMTASALKTAYKAFSASQSLGADAGKRPSKSFSVSSSLATAKSTFTGKILDAMLELSSSEYQDKITEVAVSASLGAAHTLRVSKNRGVVMNFASTLSKVVGKALSAAIVLSSFVERGRRKLLRADITLFVARTRLAKKVLESALLMTSSPNRLVQLTGSVLMSLNVLKETQKVYLRTLSGILSIVSQINRKGIKGLMSQISLLLNKTKKIDINNVVSAQITAESDEISVKTATFSGMFELIPNISKQVSLNKGAFVLMEGANIRQIIGSATVYVATSATLSLNVLKRLEVSQSLLTLSSRSIGKNLSVSLTPTGSSKMEITKTLSTSIAVGASAVSSKGASKEVDIVISSEKIIAIRKENGALMAVTGNGSKQIEGVANVAVYLAAESESRKAVFTNKEANIIISSEKNMVLAKEKKAYLSLTGSGNKNIDGVSDVAFNLTAEAESKKAVLVNKETGLELGASRGNRIKIELSEEMTLGGAGNTKTEGEASAQMAMSASQNRNTAKKAGSSVEMSAGITKAIKTAAGVSIMLSSEKGGGTSYAFYSAVNVDSEKAVKQVGKNIKIFGGDGGSINMIPAVFVSLIRREEAAAVLVLSASSSLMLTKNIIASLDLAGAQKADIEGSAAVSVGLSAEAVKRVRRSSDTTFVPLEMIIIDIYKAIKKTLSVSVGLSAVSDEKYDGVVRNTSFGISATASVRVAKGINKNITLSAEEYGKQEGEAAVTITFDDYILKRPIKLFQYKQPEGGATVFGTFSGHSFTDNNSSRNVCRTPNGDLYAVAVIANRQGPHVYKSTDGGATWALEAQISTDNWSQQWPCILVDNDGYLHVTWSGVVGGGVNRVRHSHNRDGAWSYGSSIYTSSTNHWKPAMALDKNGNIVVIFKYWATGGVRMSSYYTDGGWWSYGGIVFSNTSTGVVETDIVTFGNGDMCVAQRQGNNTIQARRYDVSLKEPWYSPFEIDQAAWKSVVDVSNPSYAAQQMNMAADSFDVVHMVFTGLSAASPSVYQIMYSKSADKGETWTTPVNLTSEAVNQTQPTISVDQQGNLYVSWTAPLDSDPTYNKLRQKKCTNGSWGSIETLTSGNVNWYAASGLYAKYPTGTTIPYVGSAVYVRGSSGVYVSSDFSMSEPPKGLRLETGASINAEVELHRTHESALMLGTSVIIKVTKAANATINISGGSGETVDYYRDLSSTASLGASLSIMVAKTAGALLTVGGQEGAKEINLLANVEIYISGHTEASQETTLYANISLGASMAASKLNREDREAEFQLEDQKAVKRVGKTFKIREHTPSVWHNC